MPPRSEIVIIELFLMCVVPVAFAVLYIEHINNAEHDGE
jgi:hypothetical protein